MSFKDYSEFGKENILQDIIDEKQIELDEIENYLDRILLPRDWRNV